MNHVYSNIICTFAALLVFCCPSFAIQEDYSITASDIIYGANYALMPSIVKASNGDLICAICTAADFEAGKTYLIKSTDNGKTWSDPYITIASKYTQGAVNCYLANDPNGNIMLVACDVNKPVLNNLNTHRTHIEIYISYDNGQTFPGYPNSPIVVPTDSTDFQPVTAPPLIASNNDILLPGYISNFATNGPIVSGVWRSIDGGQTWSNHERVFADEEPNDPNYQAFNELDIVKRSDGSLLAVGRTDLEYVYDSTITGVLYSCESYDDGNTWTTPQKLDQDGTGHFPALYLWPDGAVMLGCRVMWHRGGRITVFVSDDGDPANFKYLFEAEDPIPYGGSATGAQCFVRIDDNSVYMSYYAQDSNLEWYDNDPNISPMYIAGNLIERHQQRSSAIFPYEYKADVLPSAANPSYTFDSFGTISEVNYATMNNGVLALDSYSNGVPNEAAIYTLSGGSGTLWNPGANGTYTIEIRMKSHANNSSIYNVFFEFFDDNSIVRLQVWSNKVDLNTVQVDGFDNSTDFHIYRIVALSHPDRTDQRFNLYRDGELIIQGAVPIVNYTSAQVKFGDMTGSQESNIEIDYIRLDDENAYLPGPVLSSSEFGYKYEADTLPSSTSPAYTYVNSVHLPESNYASVSNGRLTMNSMSDGQDSDVGWYHMVGGIGTLWNPSAVGPYTLEFSMKSLANNDTTYNAWIEFYDINTIIRLQVWSNKLNFMGVTVTGFDNSSDFHTYRIVSDEYLSSADQKFDLYRDGVLIVSKADNSPNYDGIQINFGDMTGYAESNIEIDYIRWDDGGYWEPL